MLAGVTFEFGARNVSKQLSRGLLKLLLKLRPELLQNSLLEASSSHQSHQSHQSGTTFELGARNASKHFAGSLPELLLRLGSDIFKIVSGGFLGLLLSLGLDMLAGVTFEFAARNVSKQLSRGLLNLLLKLRPEMFQNSLLEPSWMCF